MSGYDCYPPNYSEFDDLGTRTGAGEDKLEEGYLEMIEEPLSNCCGEKISPYDEKSNTGICMRCFEGCAGVINEE